MTAPSAEQRQQLIADLRELEDTAERDQALTATDWIADTLRRTLALLDADAQSLTEAQGEIAEWRGWAQFVYLGGGPATLPSASLRLAVCAKHDADLASLTEEGNRPQLAEPPFEISHHELGHSGAAFLLDCVRRFSRAFPRERPDNLVLMWRSQFDRLSAAVERKSKEGADRR